MAGLERSEDGTAPKPCVKQTNHLLCPGSSTGQTNVCIVGSIRSTLSRGGFVDSVEVSSADIARIAGVKPTAVSNWRRRHDDFPAPVGGTDRSPRFDLAQVEEWLSTHRRVPTIDPEQRLWQVLDSLRGSASLDELLGPVGALALYLRDHAESTPTQDPASLMNAALSNFRERLRASGSADLVDHPPSDLPHTLLPALVEATVRAVADSGAAPVLERLTQRLEQHSPAGSHNVPADLADLMVHLTDTDGALTDPACGGGTLLVAAARAGRGPLRGQDREVSRLWLAALRLAFEGALSDQVDLRLGDALREPALLPGTADAVVTAPPFGERNWGLEELVDDPRWVHGLPPRLESDLAWVQHALSQVRPGGRAVLLMPPAAAQRPSGRRIRRSLLRSGAFRAVISLPAGFAAHYAVPLQLWVLRRADESSVPVPLLMVDTEPADPGEVEPAEEVIARIRRVWEAFRSAPGEFEEIPGTARAVDPGDLLDEEVDLTPRRHLPPPRSGARDLDLFARRRTEVERSLRSLRSLLPEVPETLPENLPTPVITLGELAKAGSVTIRRPRPRRSDEEDLVRTPARVLTARDVVRGVPASRTEPIDADPMRNPPLREGDVVVPAVTERPMARVITARDAGAHPDNGLFVVSTNPAAVDPWFLAGFVSSGTERGHIVRVSSSLRGSLRLDPSRFRLPVLSIQEQRSHGERFRRVERFRAALRELQELGEELADQAVDLAVELTTEPDVR